MLDKSILVIARYENEVGLHTHIDNLERASGPIFTMSMGPSESIYDLIPVKSSENNPVRIYIKKGEIAMMDGISRYMWFHGLPDNFKYDNNGSRFSIVLITDNFMTKQKIYSEYWDQWINISFPKCDNRK